MRGRGVGVGAGVGVGVGAVVGVGAGAWSATRATCARSARYCCRSSSDTSRARLAAGSDLETKNIVF